MICDKCIKSDVCKLYDKHYPVSGRVGCISFVSKEHDPCDTCMYWDDKKTPPCRYEHTDMVHKETLQQIMWERDLALKQLKELGYRLGEKGHTGCWIENDGWDGDVYYECSVCKEAFCMMDGTPIDNMYYYCPHCGAAMAGEIERREE